MGYGLVLWIPAFFVRSHGLSQTEVGLTLALVIGVVGGCGTFSAGLLADFLAKRDPRWNTGVIAIAKIIMVPFGVAAFMAAEYSNVL